MVNKDYRNDFCKYIAVFWSAFVRWILVSAFELKLINVGCCNSIYTIQYKSLARTEKPSVVSLI